MERPWAEASAEGEKVQTLGSRRRLRGGQRTYFWRLRYRDEEERVGWPAHPPVFVEERDSFRCPRSVCASH